MTPIEIQALEIQALDFLKRWLAWAEAGAVTDEFMDDYGLCGNASVMVEDWLAGQFDYVVFPFGVKEYLAREDAKTQHKCPKRLAWVRAKIVELEAKK